MSSFYGGKQGRTYNIVHTYSSISEMLEKFHQGGAYNIVNYGEYVIISTENRNNPENGLLYRRGFNYNEPCIVKSCIIKDSESGELITLEATPVFKNYENLEIEGVDDNEQIQLQRHAAYNSDFINYIKNPGYGAIFIGSIAGPEGAVPAIKALSWEDFINDNTHSDNYTTNLVMNRLGREEKINDDESKTITYADEINLGIANVQDEIGNINLVHMSVDIPITTFDVDIDTDAYKQPKVTRMVAPDEEEKEGADPTDHPFYYKWKFTLPQGKKGLSFKEIKIEHGKDFKYVKTEDETINPLKNYYIENEEGNFVVVGEFDLNNEDIENYYELTNIEDFLEDSNENEVLDDDQYLTYSKINYDNNAEGDLSEHIGRFPWRVINRITANESTLRLLYVDNDTLSAELGDLKLLEEENNLYAVCIKAGIWTENDTQTYMQENTFKIGNQIKGANENTASWQVVLLRNTLPPRSLNIDYTAGSNDTIDIQSFDFLFIDEEGKLYSKYTNGEGNELQYISTIDSIKSITTEPGRLIIEYISGKEKSVFNLKTIKNIRLDNDYNEQQFFHATYNIKNELNEEESKEEEEVISSAINSILAFDRDGDNILILYSDPQVRENLPENKKVIKDWKDPTTNTTYDNMIWYNYGSLGAQYHVMGQYSYPDLLTGSLKLGFSGNLEDRMGWLVTVYDTDDNSYHLYAYDYNTAGNLTKHTIVYDGQTYNTNWYEILSLTDQMIKADKTIRVSSENETDNQRLNWQADELNDHGVWFVVSYGHDK